MNSPLPVTLVAGFLGSGKTSLLHHFISENAAAPIALLVESQGPSNPDAKALQGLCGAMRRKKDWVEEIPMFDEAEQREWLVDKMQALTSEGRFEQIFIELAGTVNPALWIRRFTEGNSPLASWAELRQVICLVDALDFHDGVVLPLLAKRAAPYLELQKVQIASADLLVLNKCDLLDEARLARCLELLCESNATAPLVETAFGELSRAVWERSLVRNREPKVAESQRFDSVPGDDPGLSSTFYRAYRPFHPERLWAWFESEHPGLLRVKGIVWLATRSLLVGGISRTRRQNACGSAGIWWDALPREEWPEDPATLMKMQETWREPYGDRRQELVLLGEASKLPEIVRQLQSCLLTDLEFSRSVEEWVFLPDPFPAWDVGENA